MLQLGTYEPAREALKQGVCRVHRPRLEGAAVSAHEQPNTAAVLVSDAASQLHVSASSQRLIDYHRAFVAEVARYGGRVADKTGDRYVAHFKSPVRAVACALDVQRELRPRGGRKADDAPVGVRMGVHVAELGEATAAAEWLAAVGPMDAVSISDAVHAAVRDRVFATGVDLGIKVRQTSEGGSRSRVIALEPGQEPLDPYDDDGVAASAGGVDRSADDTARAPRWLLVFGNAVIIAAAVAAFQVADRIDTPEAAPADAAPAARSVRGGTLEVGWAAEPGDYVVYGELRTVATAALDLVLEPLVTVTKSGVIAPGVVRSWRALDSGRSLELELRAGVMFHANPCLKGGAARAADADDLVWSLELARRRGVLGTRYHGFEPTSERLVVVTLSSSAPYALYDLAEVKLLPKGVEVCERAEHGAWPVGTGPFRFAEAPAGAAAELRRASSYWRVDEAGLGLPYLDGVRIRRVRDERSALSQVDSGALHVVRLDPTRALQVAQGLQWGTPELHQEHADKAVDVLVNAPRNVLGLYTMTFLNPGLSLQTRRVIAQSLDRAEIAAHDPQSLVGTRRFLSHSQLGYARDVVEPAAEDPSPPFPEQLHFEVGISAPDEGLMQIIEEQLTAALGIEVVAVVLPRDRVQAAISARRYDAVVTQTIVTARAPEPYPYLTDLAALASELMAGDDELDALRHAVLKEPQRDRRADLFRGIEQRLIATAWVVPLGLWPATRPQDVFLSARGRVALSRSSYDNPTPRPWPLVQLIRPQAR